MPRTSSRPELFIMLVVALMGLAIAITATMILADAPAVTRTWPMFALGVNYLAGFVLVIAMRLVASRTRPTSLQGLMIPAIWYGLAATAATWGPGSIGALTGGSVPGTIAAACVSAVLAAFLFDRGLRSELRIDPAEEPAADDTNKDWTAN